LASPFPDGHRPNFCRESFIATIDVQVYEKDGWMPWSAWKQVANEKFQGGSLEFAGGYYPERGEKKE
jgi:tocopherol cyclase